MAEFKKLVTMIPDNFGGDDAVEVVLEVNGLVVDIADMSVESFEDEQGTGSCLVIKGGGR